MTSTYVTPKSGINTRRALLAFRYCWVSTLLGDHSFVIITCEAWRINLGNGAMRYSKLINSPSHNSPLLLVFYFSKLLAKVMSVISLFRDIFSLCRTSFSYSHKSRLEARRAGGDNLSPDIYTEMPIGQLLYRVSPREITDYVKLKYYLSYICYFTRTCSRAVKTLVGFVLAYHSGSSLKFLIEF